MLKRTVRRKGKHAFGAKLFELGRGLDERAGRVNHVVDNDDVASVHRADLGGEGAGQGQGGKEEEEEEEEEAIHASVAQTSRQRVAHTHRHAREGARHSTHQVHAVDRVGANALLDDHGQ